MLKSGPPAGPRRATYLSIAILLLATEAIYLPWPILNGTHTLFGYDYTMLHMRRLAFARAALEATHRLPEWYPRELLGAPFLANLQSFAWIPTHLVLLLFQPERAYAVGTALAAALAALFTYLYCRRAGFSHIAAIAAGWTFACAGCFAAHVTVGFLSSLEAYPALPLLLWLGDRAAEGADDLDRRANIAALAIATTFIVSAGHPQLPVYSAAIAILYVLWRARGWLRAKLVCAIALGIGATMIVWWPMLLLIGRSTRVLHLNPSANDIALPYHRLLGLIAPGIDGWPDGLSLPSVHRFTSYPHPGYFWDTFAYVGILPLVAAAALVCFCLARKRQPSPRLLFLAFIGVAALLCALPLFEPLRRIMPGTLLRSPARLLYVCTFVLAVAFGSGIDCLSRLKTARLPLLGSAAALACLAFHAWDLGHISRVFILPTTWPPVDPPEFHQIPADGSRIAVDPILSLRVFDDYDDAGAYDSILLAEPYRSLMALAGAPAGLNEEVIDASTWPPAALQAAGVSFVITSHTRADLELAATASDLRMYRVTNPAPRASLSTATACYRCPTSDRILIRSSSAQPGVVEILEAFDPGWTARVDDVPTPVAAAGLGMAVPVPAGEHSIDLRYHTPGRLTGAVLSVVSVSLLIALMV